ncbi:MAG: TIGR03118 family protein [Gaiellaceae bacterium]
MGEHHARLRMWVAAVALALAAVVASALPSATSAAEPNTYVVTSLVSDEPGVAPVQDPDLVNPWGLDALAGSPWWVADNETDVSTLYQANGTRIGLTVDIPGGAPTGLVANAGSSFVVTEGALSGASRFIFATQNGVIAGWNPGVNPTQAIVAVNRPDAVYTGLAIAGDRLYAADFLGARVDVFGGAFNPIVDPDAFVDPMLPDGFAPFGIQNIGGTIFVAYAKQGEEEADEEEAGQGLGFVDAFDTSGNTCSTGRSSSGRNPSVTCLGVTPSGNHSGGISSPGRSRRACRRR